MSTFRQWDHLQPDERMSVWFDDFHKLTAADWTITTTEAGAGDATEVITPGPHGVLLITNDAADNDMDQFQWTVETFKFVIGKKLSFKIRWKVSDATQSDVLFGLCITDTSLIASAPTDGVYFRKDDGDTLLDFVVAKNSTASTLTGVLGTATAIADDTWYVTEFYYDGGAVAASVGVDAGRISAFMNGVRVGSLPLTNLVDDEDLAISFALMNGEAVAKTMSIDYILVRAER